MSEYKFTKLPTLSLSLSTLSFSHYLLDGNGFVFGEDTLLWAQTRPACTYFPRRSINGSLEEPEKNYAVIQMSQKVSYSKIYCSYIPHRLLDQRGEHDKHPWNIKLETQCLFNVSCSLQSQSGKQRTFPVISRREVIWPIFSSKQLYQQN